MRFIKTLLASAGMMLATAATAVAATLQDPQSPVKVEVHTSETHTVWYLEPVWIVVGALAVVLIIVLAVMAARGRDSGSSTTVVR